MIDKVRSEGADLGHRLGRGRRPLLLHRRRRGVRRRRLRLRAARPRRAREAAGGGDPLRRALLAGGSRHGARRGRHAAHQPRGPRVLQVADARGGRRLRRRGLGPLLLRRLLRRRLRDAARAAHARAARPHRARRSPSCSSPTARATSSPARSTRRSPTRPARIEAIRARYADATITELDGISVDYDDWHFNVRASNTEPFLRLCLESLVSREDMEARRDEVLRLIRS